MFILLQISLYCLDFNFISYDNLYLQITHWKHAFKMFLKSLQHADASDNYNLKIKPHILNKQMSFPWKQITSLPTKK